MGSSEETNAEVRPPVTAGHVAKEIAFSPPVHYGLGNIFVLAETATIEGQILNATVLGATMVSRGYEVVTGREMGMPYGVRSVVNLGLAFSIVARGIDEAGTEAFLTGDAHRLALFTGVAFLGYGVANVFQAVTTARANSKNAVSNVGQVLSSGSGAAITAFEPIQTAIFALAGGQALRNKKYDPSIEVTDVGSFVRKHSTPATINALGFYAGAAMDAFVRPYYAAAKFVWGTAKLCMEPDKTKQMGKDAIALLTKKPA